MKKMLGVFVVLVLGCGSNTAPIAKFVARQAVDLALAACVAEHEWMEENELVKVCLVAEDMMPLVRELLSAHKRGVAMKASRGTDGGI